MSSVSITRPPWSSLWSHLFWWHHVSTLVTPLTVLLMAFPVGSWTHTAGSTPPIQSHPVGLERRVTPSLTQVSHPMLTWRLVKMSSTTNTTSGSALSSSSRLPSSTFQDTCGSHQRVERSECWFKNFRYLYCDIFRKNFKYVKYFFTLYDKDRSEKTNL